eukprot:403356903
MNIQQYPNDDYDRKLKFDKDLDLNNQKQKNEQNTDLKEPLLGYNQAINSGNNHQKVGYINQREEQAIGRKITFKIRFQSIVGLLCMLMALTFLAISNTFVKILFNQNNGINVLEILLIRGIFAIVLNQIIILAFYRDVSIFKLNRDEVHKLLQRAAFSYMAWVLQFYSINYLPLGLVNIIQNLIPIFTSIFAYLILRETLKMLEIINILVSLTGVIFVVIYSTENQNTQPPNFDSIDQTSSSNKSIGLQEIGQFMFVLSIVMNFLSAMIASLTGVIIRQLKTVHFTLIAGFQAICSVIVSLTLLLFYHVFFTDSTSPDNLFNKYSNFNPSTDIQYIFGVGLFGAFSQICYVKALFYDKAGRVASLNPLQIVYGYAADVIFFAHSLQMFEVVGSSVVLTCSAIVFFIKCYYFQD